MTPSACGADLPPASPPCSRLSSSSPARNWPICPVWLDWAGLGPREIAIVTAAPLFVRVAATPVIAFAADRSGDHRRFLIGLSWAALAALVVLAQSRGFWPILAADAGLRRRLDHHHAAHRDRGNGRGQGCRPRLWPHAAVGVAQLHRRQLLRRLGGRALGSRQRHLAHRRWRGADDGRRARTRSDPSASVASKTATRPPRLELSGALPLLSSRAFLLLLVAGGAVQAAHAVLYTFGTLHWRAQGLSAELCGLLVGHLGRRRDRALRLLRRGGEARRRNAADRPRRRAQP